MINLLGKQNADEINVESQIVEAITLYGNAKIRIGQLECRILDLEKQNQDLMCKLSQIDHE